jgi:hypothetical protein
VIVTAAIAEFANLFFRQMQFVADHRHERRQAEPSEEAQKKREPGHVKGPHWRAVKIQKMNRSRFVANVHTSPRG